MQNKVKITDIPCYECICLPICRGKSLSKLIDCDKLHEFLMTDKTKKHLYPYLGPNYNAFFSYMRTHRGIIKHY